jgi:hypothetical protein
VVARVPRRAGANTGPRTWAVLAETAEEARDVFLAHLAGWQVPRAVIEAIDRIGDVLGLD